VPEKRVILRADLTPRAKAGLEEICKTRGMTSLSVISRLVLWFSQQDGRTQHAVMGHTKEDASELLIKNLTKKISDSAKSSK
jgi:hypothetical protein